MSTFNKAQMSKELRKALDAHKFFNRLTTSHGGPHIYYVTMSGSSLPPVQVWVETTRFTIFGIGHAYDETYFSEVDKIISHLKSLTW